jgi:urea transport system permease protein
LPLFWRVWGCWSGAAQALTAAEAHGIATGETDARIEALARPSPPATRTAAFIQALAGRRGESCRRQGLHRARRQGFDPATGAATVPDDAEDVVNNNRMRGELEAALAALKLFSRRQGAPPGHQDAARARPTNPSCR